MAARPFFTATLFLFTAAALSAQAPTALHEATINGSGVVGLVDLLVQNALSVLLGVVVLMGIAWIFCIGNACAGLNKNPKKARVSSLFLWLCMAAGLGTFGSSCTATQQAQAANIQASRMAEGGHCICHTPYYNRHDYGNSGLSNRYPYHNSSNETGRLFCRQHGQRIYYRNR